MRLLADTHTAIWSVSVPERLPADIVLLLSDPENEVLVSTASLWEIAMKYPLRRWGSPPFSAADAVRAFAATGFELLDVASRHAVAVGELPLLHFDPFDRLIVAQALTEQLRLVTHDRTIARYSEATILF